MGMRIVIKFQTLLALSFLIFSFFSFALQASPHKCSQDAISIASQSSGESIVLRLIDETNTKNLYSPSELSDEIEVIIRIPVNRLSSFLEFGLLNQYQTDTNPIKSVLIARKWVEDLLLGSFGNNFENLSTRPKYGSVVMKQSKARLHDLISYGEVGLVLKPEVFKRSTFFPGDSAVLQRRSPIRT